MNKRLGIIFILISVLFLYSCGIPSIYVPASGDININSKRVYINSSNINSSLVRSGYPKLNIYYQISPVGLETSYPLSSINNSFTSDYCNETSGRLINKRDGRAFYTTTYSTTIDGTSVKPEFGLYQFVDSKTGETINIPVEGLDKLLNNEWNYTFVYDETNSVLRLSIITSTGTEEYDLFRFNGAKFLNSENSYINNEIPSDYEPVSMNVTDYELHVYGLVTLQYNNYNNIYNSKPQQMFSINLGII